MRACVSVCRAHTRTYVSHKDEEQCAVLFTSASFFRLLACLNTLLYNRWSALTVSPFEGGPGSFPFTLRTLSCSLLPALICWLKGLLHLVFELGRLNGHAHSIGAYTGVHPNLSLCNNRAIKQCAKIISQTIDSNFRFGNE